MKIFEWIKKIIASIRKVKFLNEPGLEIVEGSNETSSVKIDVIKKQNNSELFEGIQNESLNKTDKVIDILKTIGCTDSELIEDCDYKDLDIQNFKNNINTLTQFSVSKIELGIAISSNPDLIYIDNRIMENSIEKLQEWIDDEEILKDIIYYNPHVIKACIDSTIESKLKIFKKYNIPIKCVKNIMEDTPRVLTMDEEVLNNSLYVIREEFSNEQAFIEELMDNSMIIGITDSKYLKNYIGN